MFIDTHAHLFFDNFNEDLEQVLERAKIAAIDYIIIPSTNLETLEQARLLAEKYEHIYFAAGIHPHDTKNWEDSIIDELKSYSNHKKIVAIGEIGLDYYYDFSPKENQKKAFISQIELALQLNLPIIIHNRDSNEDMMEIMRQYANSGLKAQHHCFAGSLEDARELIEMGHFISFPGNLTYKKMDSLREIASKIDINNLLLETDSPFLTPVPYRGKRNEPSYIKFVAETISQITGYSLEEVGRATNYNAFNLFGIGSVGELRFTYPIKDSLYINVTNRCNADCVFCDRKGNAVINGYNLKMSVKDEPSAQKYIEEIGDPSKYKEIVFCGYGEPTLRWEVVKKVAAYVKENGGKTRINTNGHGNFLNKRDITPELKNLIDSVSISLNSVYPEQYAELMRVDEKMHSEMIDFARKANNYTKVIMSIVGMSSVDQQKAINFITNEIGVDYRIRSLF